MDKILVVGSGASGVHFALSVLEKGYEVTMVDVGRAKPVMVNPNDSFRDLKANLGDPVDYFLGRNYRAVVHPGSKGEYYGFPPNKSYVFAKPDAYQWAASGFAPLSSFAQGGLAETWTAGAYPLSSDELAEFPISLDELKPYYGEIAKRIGVAGVDDDMSRFYPLHENLSEPLRLDRHSKKLLADYESNKSYLNSRLNCYVGRSRVATLSGARDARNGCTYCGRCLWGCPTGALYTPSLTLEHCLTYRNFKYVPNVYVSHFRFNSKNRIEAVVVEPMNQGNAYEIKADRFVLAAGTLSSSKIFMDSIWKTTGELTTLPGLMDNRQILIPFLNIGMIGVQYNPENYQYHQVALGIASGKSSEYIHGQITTLKGALVHPILQNLPLDLGTSVKLFRNVRTGLGVVNVNLGDWRRESNYLTIQPDLRTGRSRLFINYSPPDPEQLKIKRAVKLVKKCLWRLGCIVPPGMMHVRPMGASVHYAGTVPMSSVALEHTSSKYCQSHDLQNLYFVDGTTFPVLPAKNITFALMSNAARVAAEAF